MGEKRRRVLIVDDASLMRLVIRSVVEKEKRNEIVGACSNGQEALDQLKFAQPDVILVDIEMPVMDGLTFLRNARLKTRAKIVVLSSVAPEGSDKAREARQLGADAIIQKPSGSVSFDLEQRSGQNILDTITRLVPIA